MPRIKFGRASLLAVGIAAAVLGLAAAAAPDAWERIRAGAGVGAFFGGGRVVDVGPITDNCPLPECRLPAGPADED